MNLLRTAMLIAVLTALFMLVGYLLGGSSGMVIAFVIAAAMNIFSYWNADKMVLRMNRAVQVDASNAPEFYQIVAEMARRANLPMPKVYLIDQPQPNAFATGRNAENAAVAATTGLLQRLNADEVGAVMAHELAHVQYRDTLTMTITATLAGAISMLGNYAIFFGGNRNSNNPLGGLGTLLAVIVAPLAAMLVQMAVSRTREYSADQRGSEISGNPRALATALRKIAEAAGRIRNPVAEANPAMAHMYIANPLQGERMDNLFSTHPNVENRIRILEEMAASGSPGRAGTGPRAEAADDGQPQSGPWGSQPDVEAKPAPQQRGPWGREPDRSSDPWS